MAVERWTFVANVESDSAAGVLHQIERRGDGAWRCSCLRFRFCRGRIGSPEKTCSHLRAYHGSGPEGQEDGGIVVVHAQQASPRRGAKVAEETFTFRRAFAFDGKIPGASA